MRSGPWSRSTRVPTLLWGALCVLCGALLCFVPLFNLLGYESSLVLGLLISAAAAHLGVWEVAEQRRQQSLADADLATARPGRTVLRCFGQTLLTALFLLLSPLLLLLLNGLRVRNCDYLAGLSFFVMMPVASAACAAALGTIAGLWTARRRTGLLWAYGFILGSLLWAGWRFLASPAIYAYDPFFGYFPGSLYDEAVVIEAPLYAARACQGLWAAAGLLLTAGLLQGRGLRARLLATDGWLLAGGLALLVAAGTLFTFRGEVGIHRNGADIARVLSSQRRTTHFLIRYSPGSATSREIDLIAREHELRYQQLRATLGRVPDWPLGLLARLLSVERHAGPEGPLIISYVFDSARQKHQLMGATNTYIAKPWRREIYLQHEPWPHPVLKHELAHVFFGAAGDVLLRISMRGIIPNQGLIEGVAVAADWPGGKLTGHQAVKAMREAKLEPPLSAVLSVGFLSLASGRAYTVAGSFCRYLLDRYGPAPLLQVYREGGTPQSFRTAFAAPLSQLAADWWRFIDGQEVAPTDREVAREQMRHPAVFRRVCSHELAVRRQQADEAVSHGDVEAARRLLLSICQDDPGEPRHLFDLMDLLWNTGQRKQAAEVARALLDQDRSVPVPLLAARALALLGDEAWLGGDAAAARGYYQQTLRLPLDETLARMLTAKLLALDQPLAGPLILRVIIGEPGTKAEERPERDSALDPLILSQAIARQPQLGLAHYLLGRQLYNHGDLAEAARELSRSVDLGLPDLRFSLQAEKLIGQSFLRTGDLGNAQLAFDRLLTALPPGDQGQRLEIADWLDRTHRWPSLK